MLFAGSVVVICGKKRLVDWRTSNREVLKRSRFQIPYQHGVGESSRRHPRPGSYGIPG